MNGKIYGIRDLHEWGESDVYDYGECLIVTCLYNKNFRRLRFSGFGNFINIIGIVGFCLEFGREEFLYIERVLFVSI